MPVHLQALLAISAAWSWLRCLWCLRGFRRIGQGVPNSERKKAHKHKPFALVNVQMALGQTAGCPRVTRAKKFLCWPQNTGNINFSLWLTGGLSQGCPDFQKVSVFKVYLPFSCPTNVRRVKSTPGLTPILVKSIAIYLPFLSRYFCKSMSSSWQKIAHAPPICITIPLPFVLRCFFRSIWARGRLNTPTNRVFQTVFFRFLTRLATEVIPFQRGKDCLKTPLFSIILVPSALADPGHPLNTPLWKTPFRKHRLSLLG